MKRSRHEADAAGSEELQRTYELGRILGSGSFAHVRLARSRQRKDFRVAIKFVQKGCSSADVIRKEIEVLGAVGMVEDALTKLAQDEIVELDDERRAAMVSNLMVVLCGEKDAHPVVNAGSLY